MDSVKQLLVGDPIITHCNAGVEFLAGILTVFCILFYWNLYGINI